MMRLYLLILFVWLLLWPVGTASAADATPPKPEASRPAADQTPVASDPSIAASETKQLGVKQLPTPLDKVACNITDLEQAGFLTLTSVALGRSEDFGDEALVWTVKVQKPISCRHAMILLRSFSDVRFYHTEEETQKELYSTDLLYSARLAEGAIQGEVLQQDEEFQVWVLLSLRHVEILARQQIDTVVFDKPQTVRVHPLSASASRWNAAGSGIPRWFSKRQDPLRGPK
jgi:hypothetical protein